LFLLRKIIPQFRCAGIVAGVSRHGDKSAFVHGRAGELPVHSPGYVLEPTRGYAHIADQGVPVRALMHQSRFERTL
jgi:hypothetical protein